MGGCAWVTLATNDSYSLGALVLAYSLKQVQTVHKLVVLVTPGVTGAMREKLCSVFDLVQEVNVLDSGDEANLRLLKRPELGVTFTKLHCWRLTQFDKCVFLDADTMVLVNCDELFEREELSAAPDVGWPDCFNSGVFVFRPSNQTYENLIELGLKKGSWDGGDQGLLNLYFSDWPTQDISRRLPFIYNVCSIACYTYLPAFKQFGINTKIVHFIGNTKPWTQYFNTETKRVHTENHLIHISPIYQSWWDIFCHFVHPQLSTDMARSTSDVLHANPVPYPDISETTSHLDDNKNIWDPWDEYDMRQTDIKPPPAPASPLPPYEPLDTKPIESHNTNAHNDASHHHNNNIVHPPQGSEDVHNSNSEIRSHSQSFTPSTQSLPLLTPQPAPSPAPTIPSSPDPVSSSSSSSSTCPPIAPQPQYTAPPPLVIEFIPKIPTESTPPVLPNECEATTFNETTVHVTPNDEEVSNSGIAGAFAQLTLGAPRTAEQTALDDHLRRQGWEAGNIDYLGKDSFDNIWNKICHTLSAGPAGVTSDVPTESAPASEIVQSPKKAPLEAPSETEIDKQAAVSKENLVPVQDSTSEGPKTQPEAPTTSPSTCQLPMTEPAPAICPLSPTAPAPTPVSPQLPTPETVVVSDTCKLPSTEPPVAAAPDETCKLTSAEPAATPETCKMPPITPATCQPSPTEPTASPDTGKLPQPEAVADPVSETTPQLVAPAPITECAFATPHPTPAEAPATPPVVPVSAEILPPSCEVLSGPVPAPIAPPDSELKCPLPATAPQTISEQPVLAATADQPAPVSETVCELKAQTPPERPPTCPKPAEVTAVSAPPQTGEVKPSKPTTPPKEPEFVDSPKSKSKSKSPPAAQPDSPKPADAPKPSETEKADQSTKVQKQQSVEKTTPASSSPKKSADAPSGEEATPTPPPRKASGGSKKSSKSKK